MKKVPSPVPPVSFHVLTPFYDLGCALLGLGHGFRQRTIRLMDIHPGQRIADIGCGTGVLAVFIKKCWPTVEVVGVDPTPEALTIAGRRARRDGLSITWREATGDKTGLANGHYDRVVSTLALHHIPPELKTRVLAECCRILRPGGFALIGDFSSAHSCVEQVLFQSFFRLEYVRDQENGKLAGLMVAAGFRRVEKVDHCLWGIDFFRGTT